MPQADVVFASRFGQLIGQPCSSRHHQRHANRKQINQHTRAANAVCGAIVGEQTDIALQCPLRECGGIERLIDERDFLGS